MQKNRCFTITFMHWSENMHVIKHIARDTDSQFNAQSLSYPHDAEDLYTK